MKPLILILCLISASLAVKAQGWQEVHITASAMRPAQPFSLLLGTITAPIHHLIEAGATYQWNKSEKNLWLQQVNAGFGYHRFLQSIIPLYTTIGYTRKFRYSLEAGARLGLGYLHSIPLNSRYVLKNGNYIKTDPLGKAQVIIRMGVYVQYKQVSLAYENFLQTPFIRSYVPLMPYNLLTLGYSMPLSHLCSTHKK